MKITSIDYSLATQSLDIYVSGCNPPHCPGCHNSELWDFNIGKPLTNSIKKYIMDNCDTFMGLVNKILILGGEPLHQDQDNMLELLEVCRRTGKDVYFFTRHEFVDVPESYLPYLDYIKTGIYDENNLGNVEYYGITLASVNQRIIKVEDIYKEK